MNPVLFFRACPGIQIRDGKETADDAEHADFFAQQIRVIRVIRVFRGRFRSLLEFRNALLAGTMQLGLGSTRRRVLESAPPPILPRSDARTEMVSSFCRRVSGGAPDTTREARVLPFFQLNRSGLHRSFRMSGMEGIFLQCTCGRFFRQSLQIDAVYDFRRRR